MTKSSGEKIAIVGGGISGLYCAYILGLEGHSVTLFEATEGYGGRIRTIRLRSSKDNSVAQVEAFEPVLKDQRASDVSGAAEIDAECKPGSEKQLPQGSFDELEFYAEFGPMRIELQKQLLLRGLFRHLGIVEDVRNVSDRDKPAIIAFPSYGSPGATNDPKYQLRPNEEGKSPFELLSLALLRIVLELEIDCGDSKDKELLATKQLFEDSARALTGKVQVASVTGDAVLPIFANWVKDLSAEQLFLLQCYGTVRKTPLHAIGFWNLLSDFLSHDAIIKIRDLGTFYHLLPENPNAAEWLTWWLNGISIGDNLQGVYGGMSSLVEKFVAKIRTATTASDAKLDVTLTPGKEAIGLHVDEKGLLDIEFSDKSKDCGFKRVVLALPKVPLQKLVNASREAFKTEDHIHNLLYCAVDFPMVKVFVVVKQRWWNNERMANRSATRVPTREIHYWPARLSDHLGMIMFYTDRPATAFWANYVPPGPQEDVAFKDGLRGSLTPATEKRLVNKIAQYLSENDVPELKAEDIIWYGIRDWGREPYGGANHCWRPERKYWNVMARLGEIDVQSRSSIHVCGEAYSDYHGFIEGALRSAVYALHRIAERNGEADLKWLTTHKLFASYHVDSTSGNATAGSKAVDEKIEDEKYQTALQTWANQLDAFRTDGEDSYLVK